MIAHKIARRWIMKQAGWWSFDPAGSIYPGHTDKDTGFYIGDGPADIMDETLKHIDQYYQESVGIGRPVTKEELRAVFEFCMGGKP